MSASVERVKQDIRKLEELSRSLNGRVRVKSTSGTPVNRIVVELDYPTAPSSAYPDKIQRKTEVIIELLSRYPFQEPTAKITTPVFHPNVYASGKICLGSKWMPTQGLDLLVRRIIQIITFDSSVIDLNPPANAQAAQWYTSAVSRQPKAFPTDKLVVQEPAKKKMSWSNLDSANEQKSIVSCPQCRGALRVPTGKKLNVTCPKCNHTFLIAT